jgi:hypothetical protein
MWQEIKKKKLKPVGRQKKLGTSVYWTIQMETMLEQL